MRRDIAASERRRAVLLSNVKTKNLGNVALTHIAAHLLSEQGLRLSVRHRPPHAFTEAIVRHPHSEWKQRVERVLPQAPVNESTEIPPPLASISESTARSAVIEGLARPILRSRPVNAVRAFRAQQSAAQYFGALAEADHAFWVPAGELLETRHPVERELSMQFLVDRSVPVSVLNFSYEPHERTSRMFRRLGAAFDDCVVRDATSADRLRSDGIDADSISVCPDFVFMANSRDVPDLQLPDPGERNEQRIGLVFHGMTAIDRASWLEVVRLLRLRGLDPVILSSHPAVDARAIRTMQRAADGELSVLTPADESVRSYMEVLANLGGVVTSRFHSAVLAAVVQTPVVGVDSYGTKVRGGLAAAGLQHAAGDGRSGNWAEWAVEQLASKPVLTLRELERIRDQVRALIAGLVENAFA